MTLLDHVSDEMVSYVRYKLCVPILEATLQKMVHSRTPFRLASNDEIHFERLLVYRVHITYKSNCSVEF